MKDRNKPEEEIIQELQKIRGEYKKKEAELEDALFTMESCFDSLPVLAYKIGFDGRIIDCNRLAVQTLGYENKEEILGKPLVATVYAPVSQTKAERLFLEWKKTGKTRNEEMQVITKKGKTIDVLLNADTITNKAGVPLYSLSTQIDISEQKRNQDELRLREQELRSIFDSSPDAITVSDIEGNIVECNQAALDLHGYASKKEIIGKNGFELIASRDHGRAGKNMEITAEKGSVNNVEYTFLKKDGSEFPAVLSASAVHDDSGGISGFVAITKDITDRVLWDQMEKRLLKTLDTAREAVTITTRDGRIIYTNSAMDTLFGYEKGELLGKYPSVLNAGPKPELVIKMIVYAVIEAGFWEGELNSMKKDGTEFSTYARIASFRDADNKITNFITTQHDISEIRNVEKRYKESEEKYRTLFEFAPIALGKEDWSELKKYVDRIKKSGVEDLSQYFDDRQEDIKDLAFKMKSIRINQAVLELHEAENKKEYLSGRLKSSTDETYHFLKEILVDMAAGKTSFEAEW